MRSGKMKQEGNRITKYWLKEYKWYDWRFLVQLPLFLGYIYIGLAIMILTYGLIMLANGLDSLVNIRIWSKLFKVGK